jgi:hypothetical protein
VLHGVVQSPLAGDCRKVTEQTFQILVPYSISAESSSFGKQLLGFYWSLVEIMFTHK